MSELPAERPVTPRVDESAADLQTLVDMGVIEGQPEPPPPDRVPEE
ncbi:hypothetical protein V1460_28035 [Streptomyces sp. SCSIO 30461]